MPRGRKPKAPELRAKNATFKLYSWEIQPVKEYIKVLGYIKEQLTEILTKVITDDILIGR